MGGLRSTNRSASSVLVMLIHIPAGEPKSTIAERPAVDERLVVASPESVALHMVSETRQITTQATRCPHWLANAPGTCVASSATAASMVAAR